MPAPTRPAAPPAPKGQMYMMLMMVMMLFVMLDPSLSAALGTGMAVLLNPTIGFGGHFIVISIFFAGALTGVLSTGLRHWSSDYIALERGRILQRSFQKDMNDARMKRDVDRVDRLKRAQPFVMSRTMEANYSTMKPAIGTMVVALAVFGWLRVFVITEVPFTSVTLPWAPAWSLRAATGLPNYILLYMVMSLPLTLAIGAALKLYRYRSFDASAPLPPMPTVEDLVRRAEGDDDDEAMLKRESARAKRRLKGQPVGAEPDAADDDGEVEIVDGESQGARIVGHDDEGGEEDEEPADRDPRPGKRPLPGIGRAPPSARVVDDPPSGESASRDEE